MVDINEFTREVTCEYKGELYSVRDNGAVMRHKREGKKTRKLDNVWTFGTKDQVKGYMMLNSHRVHIIVAKAFIPGNEDGKMIVDHIDTNRCNNRVENLRWLTRLENVLLNEATLKRVTYLCGGDINKFINDPSCLRDLSGENQDIMWMRTVSAEEAKKAWEHISEWSKRPSSTLKMMKKKATTKTFDDWLNTLEIKEEKYNDEEYNPETIQRQNEWREKEMFACEENPSLTEGAFQKGFWEKLEFPLCPGYNVDGGLDAYARRLQLGQVFARFQDGQEYVVKSAGWTEDWKSIQVELLENERNALFCIHICYEERKYIHIRENYVFSFRFCGSPYVLQTNASTQNYFPLCPSDGNIILEDYANLLEKGALVENNQYGEYYVYDKELTVSTEKPPMLYVGVESAEGIKGYADLIIYIENGKIIHQLGHTYFEENYLKREFCKIRGQKWDDTEEIIDDYC